MTAAAQPTGEIAREVLLKSCLCVLVSARDGQSWNSNFLKDFDFCIEGIRSALPQQGAGEGGEVARPQTASAPQVQDVVISPGLIERLQEATPGPYGFQAYGKRERLVTMAVGDGLGEPIAIFNRAEDARAFAAAMTAWQKAIAGDPRGKADSPHLSPGLRREVVERAKKWLELRLQIDSDEGVDLKKSRAWQRFSYLHGEEICRALFALSAPPAATDREELGEARAEDSAPHPAPTSSKDIES